MQFSFEDEQALRAHRLTEDNRRQAQDDLNRFQGQRLHPRAVYGDDSSVADAFHAPNVLVYPATLDYDLGPNKHLLAPMSKQLNADDNAGPSDRSAEQTGGSAVHQAKRVSSPMNPSGAEHQVGARGVVANQGYFWPRRPIDGQSQSNVKVIERDQIQLRDDSFSRPYIPSAGRPTIQCDQSDAQQWIAEEDYAGMDYEAEDDGSEDSDDADDDDVVENGDDGALLAPY